jgi:hypothetical protein
MVSDWLALPTLKRVVRLVVQFAYHTGGAASLLLCIKALETLYHYLWGGRERLLFDQIPVRYLFDAMDGAVILVFVCYGLYDAVRAFRE